MEEVKGEVEVPKFFICPISLEIMKDPVTVITGITYDRESIEQWLSSSTDGTNSYCPITKLPLQKHTDLTPNHTLRRLIQAWCTINASNGIDRIPTPKSPLNKIHVLKLIKDLSIPELQLKSLKKLESLAKENERNRKCMIEAGISKAMVSFIRKLGFKNSTTSGLEEALSVLHLMVTSRVISMDELRVFVKEDQDLVDLLTWVLRLEDNHIENYEIVKTHAISVLKSTIEVSNVSVLQRLKPEFFETVVQILREKISYQATKSALQILLESSPWSRNRVKITEAGAVWELIELELDSPEKRITELILGVLDSLCCCADGRAKFLDHAGGIAMVSKRIFRVSQVADDFAIRILASICRFSATNEVLQEMLNVGAVSKICMVLQAENETHVKDNARLVLRLHSNFWNNSPCIQVYLLTRQVDK